MRRTIIFIGYVVLVFWAGMGRNRCPSVRAEPRTWTVDIPPTEALPDPQVERRSSNEPPTGTAPPMYGEEGTDRYGYPLRTADRRALLALLRDSRFELLTKHIEYFQQEFASDYRKESWIIDALDSFSVADPALESLLDAWAHKFPKSFVPHAANGFFQAELGWEYRGGAYAKDTAKVRFDAMKKHHARAIKHLQDALALEPRLVAAQDNLISIAMAGSRPRSDKVRTMERALASCPLCLRIRETFMYSLQPKWGGSILLMESFARVSVAKEKDNPALTSLMGYPFWSKCEILNSDQLFEEAIANCDRAVELGDNALFFIERADAYIRKDQFFNQQVLADLDRALRLRPYYLSAYRKRSFVLRKLDRWEKSAEDLRMALELNPADSDLNESIDDYLTAAIYIARKHWEAGDGERGAQIIGAGLGLDPKNRSLSCWHALMRSRRYSEDKDLVFISWTCFEPDKIEHYIRLDQYLAYFRRFKEIVAYWDRFIANHPRNARAYLERGGAYFHMNNTDAAYRDAKRACDLGNREGCIHADRLKK